MPHVINNFIMLTYTSTFYRLYMLDCLCKAKNVSHTLDSDFGTEVLNKVQNVTLYLLQNFLVVFFCDIKCLPVERSQ